MQLQCALRDGGTCEMTFLILIDLILFQFCCTAVLGKGNKIDKQIKKGEKSFNKNIFERLMNEIMIEMFVL